MSRKIGITLLLTTALSAQALAQTPNVPPPWFDLDEKKQERLPDQSNSALPQITSTDLEKLDQASEKQAPSPLETFYRTRTQDKSLTQFGYTLFGTEKEETQGKNAPLGAVQDDYVLGTGDELLITFTGQRTGQITTKIDPRGQITIKDFPPIPAAGRTLAELRESLKAQTENLPNTQSYVSLSKIRQIGVLIVGHVEQPGRKTLSAFQTVFDALRLSGGIQKQGSLRQIKLVRGGLSTTIDLYDLLMDGAPGTDITLKDGDRLIIPPLGATLAVTGAVKRPAIYELKSDDKLSLNKTLLYAGGVLSPGQNRFMRRTPSTDGRENIEQVTNNSASLFGNGSILDVLRGTDKPSGSIEILGHTSKPGQYDHKKYRTLSALLSTSDLLGNDIYPLIGLIDRRSKTLLSREIIAFSPQIVLERRRDHDLQENDKIILLSNKEIKQLLDNKDNDTNRIKKQSDQDNYFQNNIQNDDALKIFLEDQQLHIRGAVRDPGSYPAAPETPLSALIAAAGKMTREADLSYIEITARTSDKSETYRTTLSIDPHNPEYTNPNDVLLSPGDAVRIGGKTTEPAKQNTVLIIGEVNNPGTYDLLPGDTTATLLKRVGGLTDQAYPAGAIFSRESARKTEELRYRATARDLERRLAATIGKEDNNNPPNAAQIEIVRDLAKQLSAIKAVGRITAELDPDILEVRPELDMLLEGGDKIYIPQRPLTVRVSGEVFSPAALQFRRDKDPLDYIHEAGGFTKAADKNRTFVLMPDGSAKPLKVNAWNHTPIHIPPGATIVVPLDPKPFDFLNSAKEIGQIIGNLAVTAVFIDDIRD